MKYESVNKRKRKRKNINLTITYVINKFKDEMKKNIIK